MGVLRALGLKRRSLVGLAVIEGAWYSLAAGLVGAVVGMVAGWFIAARFGRAFALFAGEDFDFEFHYSLKASTVVAGFAAGTILTLIVVFFAARRTSRMTITAAIRNLPEPPAEKIVRPWPRRIRLAAFGILGVVGLVAPAGTPDAVIGKLHGAFSQAVRDPEIVKTMTDQGAEAAAANTPAEFAAFIASETEKFGKITQPTDEVHWLRISCGRHRCGTSNR